MAMPPEPTWDEAGVRELVRSGGSCAGTSSVDDALPPAGGPPAGMGRAVRAGALDQQAASTFDMIDEALRRRDAKRAAELARYLLVEGAEPVELFPVFHTRARRFLADAGVPEECEERASRHLPAGVDLVRAWERFASEVERFARDCDRSVPRAPGDLDAALSEWRVAHDWACDVVKVHLAVCARELGEERVGEMWDALLGDLYASRDRYDPARARWADLMEVAVLDACETFRGHLSGPARRGTIEVREEPERVAISFTPCGTGGRSFVDGAARSDHEFTAEPHPWSWGRAGVCLYCAHCCLLQERVPIQRFGVPVRVIEPPQWPPDGDGRCTWYVYRDPSLVPAEVYARLR
ncbi:MAG: hypothetical protein ACYDEN_00170 [Acidimicrobiales bacterium]